MTRQPRAWRTAPVRPGRLDRNPHPLTLPAFWLVSALLLAGAVRIGLVWRAGIERFPVATTVAVLVFALYAVPFWSALASLDYLEREPAPLLAAAFAWGGLVATSLAFAGTPAAHNLLAKLASPGFAAAWGPAVAGATVEEIAKVLGVWAILLLAADRVNSVLDGFIFGALVGLGFQVVENVVYAIGAVALSGRGDQVDPVVTTLLLRGLLGGLWSHTLFTGLAGAGIGYLVVRRQRPLAVRLLTAGAGVAGGWLAHFVWNTPLWVDGSGPDGWGLLAVLVLKGAPALVVLVLVVRAAHRRQADYYLGQLADLGDRRVVTDAELTVLGSGPLRAEARRQAARHAGHRAARAVRRLQAAQARLAVALSRAAVAGPHSDRADAEVSHWHRETLAQRERLAACGHPEAAAVDVRRARLRRWAGTAAGLAALGAMWWAIRALHPS
ncbi:MAG TPA: PrsW family intramembrane metalloprotease [Pilimelia sp.]|nr:PrsW family intramembrane metalloprotease [Pilimelia sp.]